MLEEAKELAAIVEQAMDEWEVAQIKAAGVAWPWDKAISLLEEQINSILEERDSNPRVIVADRAATDAEGRLSNAIGDLKRMAMALVNAKALFPSGKKSQVLTDRITLKSQMPSLPEVVDPMTLIESLVNTGRLREFAKSVSIKLDNDMAEAIKRWFSDMAMGGYDVGLEAPQPKILDIKVKPKEEKE